MITSVSDFLEKVLISTQKPIVVGISGGPDSMVLLHILGQLHWPVVVGYLDHGARDTAGKDAEFVKRAAEAIKADYFDSKVDVPNLAEKTKTSFEAVGRTARYQFLFSLAKTVSAQAVAVGHTADDQVETVLMHFIRGAGSAGLMGMQEFSLPNQWSDQIPLIRPLLGFWRYEIIEYCEKHNLDTLTDWTNYDLKYSRNRIRHEVIPFLEKINPQFKTAVLNASKTLSEENKLIQPIYKDAWQKTTIHIGNSIIRLDRKRFSELPTAVQRAVIRNTIRHLTPDLRNIEFKWIDGVLRAALVSEFPKRIDIGGGIQLYQTNDEIWLMRESESKQSGLPLLKGNHKELFLIPGAFDLSDGWHLEADWETNTDELFLRIINNQDVYQCWLQFDELIANLFIRGRKPGDRITPLGMGGRSIKISDLMINEHLPQPARAKWPLICVEDKIIWVPGYVVSQNYRVTKKNSPVLHLALVHKDANWGINHSQEYED